jgi:hypothetical protein
LAEKGKPDTAVTVMMAATPSTTKNKSWNLCGCCCQQSGLFVISLWKKEELQVWFLIAHGYLL